MTPDFKYIKCYRVNVNPALAHDKLRKHAAEILGKFMMGIFLLFIIENVVPEIIGLFLPTTLADVIAHYSHGINPAVLQTLPRVPVCCYIYALLFNGVFNLCESLYCLTLIRSREVDYRALYEGFGYFFKTLGMFVAQTIIVSFWAMFFIIPGVIAAINFSQSFFILADDPDKNIFMCMAESKLRMRGNRKMFIIYLLSFLPYVLLGAMPAIAVGLLCKIDPTTMSGLCINLALNAPLFCGIAYLSLGRCVFYELLLNGTFQQFKYKGQDVFRENISNDIDHSDREAM